jgi:hypothetical protein
LGGNGEIKRNGYGTTERYKARLVAKGYHHIEGVDYFEFETSLMAKMATIKMVLVAAASIN